MSKEGNVKYALFIGRWQPFHEGHKYIIDQALAQGKNVCIAVRGTKISDKDPFNFEQRAEMIRRVYGAKVKIISIPDIESVNVGRKVGYKVNFIDPPEEIGKISGTNIREGREASIPLEVAKYIKSLRTTLWFTGLPCSGKTTLARKVREELENKGYRTAHLDGDDVRNKLNEDLGFSEEHRHENLRRVAHVAKLFNDQGNFVLASFVSPTEKMREKIKEIIGENIKVVHVKCSLEECERRDVKGMYAKARKGEIKGFTGIDDPFENPSNPDITIDTEKMDIEESSKLILEALDL